jgi:hypothetical protein
VNADGIIDVGDVVYLINYQYKNGPVPFMLILGDVNRDQSVDISDVVFLINYLYKNGTPPINAAKVDQPYASKGLSAHPSPAFDLIK